MESVARPVRIEPAFDDREYVRQLFYRGSPYPVLGVYVPDGAETPNRHPAGETVMPWFRGNWAVGGEPRLEGVEPILFNPRFLAAAEECFGTKVVRPRTIVVNLTTPMPAGAPHVDIPSFRGATREHYPLRFLAAMGASGLFEQWRVVEAGAISWFYDGPGGGFEYWPDGLNGRMSSEQAPFGNTAVIADNDRMYHRIAEVGAPGSPRFDLGPAAQIRATGQEEWVVVNDGVEVATFPAGQVRLSVLWKAEVFADEAAERKAGTSPLTLERVMELLTTDLRGRRIDFILPQDPLNSEPWLATLREAYYGAKKGGRL